MKDLNEFLSEGKLKLSDDDLMMIEEALSDFGDRDLQYKIDTLEENGLEPYITKKVYSIASDEIYKALDKIYKKLKNL